MVTADRCMVGLVFLHCRCLQQSVNTTFISNLRLLRNQAALLCTGFEVVIPAAVTDMSII